MKYSLFKRLSNQAAGSVPNDLRGSDWQLEYDKIFAELIIQECIIRAEREWIRNGDTEHNRAVSKVIGSIKEHFGVDQ